MVTVYKTIDVASTRLRSSSSARLVKANGTNIPQLGLAFAGAGANQAGFYTWPIPNYASGNISVRIYWYADTATSGTATWGCALAAITPNSDTTDVETKALATENTNTSACSGSAQALNAVTVVITNLDSVAADDDVFLRIRRTDSSVSGDCIILGILVTWDDGTSPLINLYAPGSITVPNESFFITARHLKLTGSQRATLAGTATLRIT